MHWVTNAALPSALRPALQALVSEFRVFWSAMQALLKFDAGGMNSQFSAHANEWTRANVAHLFYSNPPLRPPPSRPMYQTRTEWPLLRQASIPFGVFTLSFSGGLQSAEIGKNGFGITNITESKPQFTPDNDIQ